MIPPQITSAIEDLRDTILVWTSKALITIQEVDQMTKALTLMWHIFC
jgi:hypothetical protein